MATLEQQQARARLTGYAWADGVWAEWGARANFTSDTGRTITEFKRCAEFLGKPAVITPNGTKWVATFNGWLPRLDNAAAPLHTLASIVEVEGSTSGMLFDDQSPERLDACEKLLELVLPAGGWVRTLWPSGGGALWVATEEALAVVRSAPYVTMFRVPVQTKA